MAKSKKKVVQTPDRTALVTQSNARSIVDSVWLPALLSCLALSAAFPPVSFYPLAWIAPMGWLLICQRKLPVGRKGYFQLWLCGCLFWLVSLHSVRLAFWVLHFGWIALSCYLAVYLPLIVAVPRTVVQRWGVPWIVAAPVTWTGSGVVG